MEVLKSHRIYLSYIETLTYDDNDESKFLHKKEKSVFVILSIFTFDRLLYI